MDFYLFFRKLVEYGELDKKLKLRKCQLVESEDEGSSRGRKTGTRKRKRFYKQQLPWPLNNKITCNSFLYKMEMRLVEELPGQRYRSYQPANDTVALGLLVAQQNAAYCTSIYISVLIHQNSEDLDYQGVSSVCSIQGTEGGKGGVH